MSSRVLLLCEFFRTKPRLLYNRQKCSNRQGLIPAMKRHRNDLSGLGVSENNMAPTLSGNHKIMCFQNLNNLASGQRFHESLCESNFYVSNNRVLFAMRDAFVFGFKLFNPKA